MMCCLCCCKAIACTFRTLSSWGTKCLCDFLGLVVAPRILKSWRPKCRRIADNQGSGNACTWLPNIGREYPNTKCKTCETVSDMSVSAIRSQTSCEMNEKEPRSEDILQVTFAADYPHFRVYKTPCCSKLVLCSLYNFSNPPWVIPRWPLMQ